MPASRATRVPGSWSTATSSGISARPLRSATSARTCPAETTLPRNSSSPPTPRSTSPRLTAPGRVPGNPTSSSWASWVRSGGRAAQEDASGALTGAVDNRTHPFLRSARLPLRGASHREAGFPRADPAGGAAADPADPAPAGPAAPAADPPGGAAADPEGGAPADPVGGGASARSQAARTKTSASAVARSWRRVRPRPPGRLRTRGCGRCLGGRCAGRCGRRRSRAGPGAGWPGRARAGSRRSRPARRRRPGWARRG